MKLEISPPTACDALEMAREFIAAYATDPVAPCLTRDMTPAAAEEYWASITAQGVKSAGRDTKMLKVVDVETGIMVANVTWKYPSNEKTEKTAEEEFRTAGTPPGLDTELLNAVAKAGDGFYAKYMIPGEMFYLAHLSVRPEYQGHGIAKLLMQDALAAADREGKKVYLTASPVGRGFYQRLGFEVLEEQVFDWTHLGAAGPRLMTAMMREPRNG